MKVAITDANIFIDLYILEILDELFHLKLEIHTTIEVIDELDDDQADYLLRKEKNGELIVYALTSQELESLGGFELSNGLSHTDRSIFFYSHLVEAVILTGDRKLRTTLQKHGKEVHGIIWIFEAWVTAEIMNEVEAADKLEELVRMNPFLPQQECFDRIKKWRM